MLERVLYSIFTAVTRVGHDKRWLIGRNQRSDGGIWICTATLPTSGQAGNQTDNTTMTANPI